MTRGRVLILLLVCGALACSCRSPTPAPPTAPPTEAPALAATHPPLSTATHTPEPSATLEPTGTPQPSVTSQSPTPTPAPSTPVPLPPTPTTGATRPEPERIVFGPDEVSATVVDEIEREGTEGVTYHPGYLVHARAGQTMEVAIVSPRGDVLLDVVSADGVPLKRYVDGASQWRGTLPATQDYFVQPVATGGSTDFTVRIIILSLEFAPQRIQFAPGATSATTSGRFVAGMSQYYVLRAQAGQRMTVMVDPPQVKVTIEGEDGSNWLAAPVGAGLTIPSLPQAQDYTIGLSLPLQIGEIAGYTMEVSVTGP